LLGGWSIAPIFTAYTNAGGNGVLRGLPRWNLDMTVAKDLTFRERFGAPFMFQFSNLLNHVRFADPTLSLASASTFGVITRSAAGSTTIPLYTPRQLEFGVRVHFYPPSAQWETGRDANSTPRFFP